jgi:DNA-binding transcriptional LysR family regulator
MQFVALRLFCDIVVARNFTRAAQWNDRTQAHASNVVRALEKKFGTTLIERSRKVFRLTRDGEVIHREFLEILRLLDEAELKIETAHAAAAVIIELDACYSIGLYQLPPCLKQFQRNFPAADVRVRYHLIDDVHDAVLDRAVHLGLVCYPRRRRGLVIDHFRHERLMMICHPAHPLAGCLTVSMSGLAGQRFLAWQEIHASPFLKNIPKHQHQLFAPAAEFPEAEMVKCRVERGAGIAILPEIIVRREVAAGRLVAVPFADAGCTEPLAVIYRQDQELTPLMEQFIKVLKEPEPVEAPRPVNAET